MLSRNSAKRKCERVGGSMAKELRMAETSRQHTNGEITVTWRPGLCQHSHNCWTQLRVVFDPRNRPWINIQGATSEQIVAQVSKCPSGALQWHPVIKPLP